MFFPPIDCVPGRLIIYQDASRGVGNMVVVGKGGRGSGLLVVRGIAGRRRRIMFTSAGNRIQNNVPSEVEGGKGCSGKGDKMSSFV